MGKLKVGKGWSSDGGSGRSNAVSGTWWRIRSQVVQYRG